MAKLPPEAAPESEPARTAQAIQALADSSHVLDLYLRYEGRYRRQLDRAHRQLLLLQRRRPPQPGTQPTPLSPLETLKLPNELPVTAAESTLESETPIPQSTFKPTPTRMAAA
jgi:hypothetical protein